MTMSSRVDHKCTAPAPERKWDRRLGGDTGDRGIHSLEIYTCLSCGYEFEIKRSTRTHWNTRHGKYRG